MKRLSGDQNNDARPGPVSDPGSGCAVSESMDRIQIRGTPSDASSRKCDLAAVRREGENADDREVHVLRQRGREAHRLGDRRSFAEVDERERRRGEQSDSCECSRPSIRASSDRGGGAITGAEDMSRSLLQQRHRVADIAQTFLRIFFQAALEKTLHLARRIREFRFAEHHCGERIGDRLAHEQPLAGEQFMHHHAERPDVGALIGRLAFGLLGSHVACGAENHPACVAFMLMVGDSSGFPLAGMRPFTFASPKSRTFTTPVGSDLDICRFQIAMDDPFFVRGFERRGDLPADLRARLPVASAPWALRPPPVPSRCSSGRRRTARRYSDG